MKKKNIILGAVAGLALTLSSFTFLSTLDWNIDTTHSIKFSTEDAEGIFKTLEGKVKFDTEKLGESSFDLKVAVSSINTGNGMKNSHAVSPNWFDADKYPNITFKSSKFTKTKEGYDVTGKLTIKDKSKTMTLPFTFDKNTFKGTFNVDRLYFGVGGMEGKQSHVGQSLKIDFSVPVKH